MTCTMMKSIMRMTTKMTIRTLLATSKLRFISHKTNHLHHLPPRPLPQPQQPHPVQPPQPPQPQLPQPLQPDLQQTLTSLTTTLGTSTLPSCRQRGGSRRDTEPRCPR